MSSQLGHVGMIGRNVYNMTKFGIEGLTKGMGVELAKKISELTRLHQHLLKRQW